MPLSPRNSGFLPLNNGNRRSLDMADGAGIPLTKVRSNASSTGARKAHQTMTGLSLNGDDGAEKKGAHAGKRKKLDEKTILRKNSGDEVSVTFMGRLYTRFKGWSGILKYFLLIVPLALALAAPLVILPLLDRKDDILVGGPRGPSLFLLFLWIEISWLSIWLGKLVAVLLPAVFMFFCGVVSSGTRKYAAVLQNLTVPLSLFFWALASFVSYQGLFRNFLGDSQEGQQQGGSQGGRAWVGGLAKFLGACFASSGIYLGEKAIVQLIGISYHQRSFANRIKDSKHEIRLLGLLYDASRSLFPMYCEEFEEEDHIINDSIDLMLARTAGIKGGKGGSTAPMKLVGGVGRLGDKMTSVFGNIASEITGKQVFNPNSAHSIVVEALEKIKPSEALARRIWMSFVCDGNDALYLEDVEEVLGPSYKEEADEAFGVIDSDENGDISLDEMVRKVVEIGKERKAIAEGMKDISQALQVFDKVLMFVVLIIVVFIFVIVYDGNVLTTVGTAGTALLSLSFVFAVTCQEFLGSCIFLFVKHPYDVGDRVDIWSGRDKLDLQVEKISLLYTVFLRIDKNQIVQTPNIQLNNMWIENVTRSKAMKEIIDVNISYDTTFEDIELLRAEMEKFVRSAENSRDFHPDFSIGVAGMGDLDKLNLKVAIKHKSNWHNEAVRAARRSKFICALVVGLKKVPIYNPGGGNEALGTVGNPAYSVTVSDEDAAGKRDEAAKMKEDKRMVPTPPKEDGGAHGKKAEDAELQAIQDFNATSPTAAALDDWGYSRQSEDVSRRSVEVSGSGAGGGAATAFQRGESRRGGFRRAGESVAPGDLADSASIHRQVGMTQQPRSPRSPTSPTTSMRRRRFDEESQMGGLGLNTGGQPAGYPGGPFSVTTSVTAPSGGNQYSLYPPGLGTVQEQEQQQQQGQQQQQQVHPLQQQPPMARSSAPSRSRG